MEQSKSVVQDSGRTRSLMRVENTEEAILLKPKLKSEKSSGRRYSGLGESLDVILKLPRKQFLERTNSQTARFPN